MEDIREGNEEVGGSPEESVIRWSKPDEIDREGLGRVGSTRLPNGEGNLEDGKWRFRRMREDERNFHGRRIRSSEHVLENVVKDPVVDGRMVGMEKSVSVEVNGGEGSIVDNCVESGAVVEDIGRRKAEISNNISNNNRNKSIIVPTIVEGEVGGDLKGDEVGVLIEDKHGGTYDEIRNDESSDEDRGTNKVVHEKAQSRGDTTSCLQEK